MKIESRVSSGAFKNEIQTPQPDKNGNYVMCQARFKEYKILVVDLDSAVNGLRAGLNLRMGSKHVQRSMREPKDIEINGMSVADYFANRKDRT